MNDRKTISIMKACELVGVSRRTIYNWIASGKYRYIHRRRLGPHLRRHAQRQPGGADLRSPRSLMMPAAEVTPDRRRTSRRTSDCSFTG